ncbi:MAG: hypothetical protein IPJ56_15345 [Gemmatimonadetes bacterium]|nr:hypothetical protein [Gemmatimonadota bacterium]
MTDPRSGSAPIPRPTPQPPAPLDRESLERVLARAAELQAGQSEPAEQMSEAQLIEVGKEVGISAEHVRLALAEERTRVQVPEARGVVGGLFGVEGITASRVVSGTPTDILGRLDDWMQREEGMRAKRRFNDRLTWEGRRDFMMSLQAGFGMGARPYSLINTDEVGATVVQVDAQRCIVRLDASFVVSRRQFVLGSSIVAGSGVLGFGGVMALAALIPNGSMIFGALLGMIPALGGGAIGYAVAATHRQRVTRAQLALEQVLDRLERGEIRKPANPLADFIDVVTRKVESIR